MYLSEETIYRKKRTEIPPSYVYEDIPDFRRAAVRLAVVMKEKGQIQNSVLIEWLDEVTNDPLPEVREAALSQPFVLNGD